MGVANEYRRFHRPYNPLIHSSMAGTPVEAGWAKTCCTRRMGEFTAFGSTITSGHSCGAYAVSPAA